METQEKYNQTCFITAIRAMLANSVMTTVREKHVYLMTATIMQIG